jgi:hypothetical protein
MMPPHVEAPKGQVIFVLVECKDTSYLSVRGREVGGMLKAQPDGSFYELDREQYFASLDQFCQANGVQIAKPIFATSEPVAIVGSTRLGVIAEIGEIILNGGVPDGYYIRGKLLGSKYEYKEARFVSFDPVAPSADFPAWQTVDYSSYNVYKTKADLVRAVSLLMFTCNCTLYTFKSVVASKLGNLHLDFSQKSDLLGTYDAELLERCRTLM